MLVMELQIIWFICKCFESRTNAICIRLKVDSGMLLKKHWCEGDFPCIARCFKRTEHDTTQYTVCGSIIRAPRIEVLSKSIRIGEYMRNKKLTKAKRARIPLVAHLHFVDCCINTSTRSSYSMSAIQIYYPSGDIAKAVLCISVILLRFQVMLWFR